GTGRTATGPRSGGPGGGAGGRDGRSPAGRVDPGCRVSPVRGRPPRPRRAGSAGFRSSATGSASQRGPVGGQLAGPRGPRRRRRVGAGGRARRVGPLDGEAVADGQLAAAAARATGPL